ncbi:hypothetical protein [Micromonospora sp. NPDC023633]|uniref:hypothetical protein n=1 Tax=Micromonospora sp. NPDC023633 TaxID=3154320 RepID=UPI0033CC8484
MPIDFPPGTPITPDLLARLVPVWARKTLDQSVTNSATLVNDTVLAADVVAGAEYDIEAKIFYEAPTANDFKFALTWPSGSLCPWGALMLVNSAAGTSGDLAPFVFGNPVPGDFFVAGGGGVGQQLLVLVKGTLVVGATAGKLQFQFAQSLAGAGTSAICKAGSTLMLRRTL